MIPLRDRNITLIDLKKYNDVQLTRISAIVGLVDGSLQDSKREGSSKLWFDFDSKTWIAVLDDKVFDSYKGLVTNTKLKLSKKEKDYLLKMKPTEFDTRKRKKQQQNVAEENGEKDFSDKMEAFINPVNNETQNKNIPLKDRNITLIDLKKYNDVQLTRISGIVGLVDGSLQLDKKEGITKVWFDFDSKVLIAFIDNNVFDTYKGLITNSDLNLSKKEKDYLLKMKPTEFDTRKRKAQQQNVAEENDERDFSDKMNAFINPVNNETQNQNIPLKDRNITLIDLKKYNDVQLTRISAIVGLVDGSLQDSKKDGVEKLWFDFDSKMFIAMFSKRIYDSYKGLATNSKLKLSKKEKDYLLKIKPTEFDTRKRKAQQQNVAETVEHKDERRGQNNELPIVLELDAILDKITEFGIDSLSDEERKYLEDTSKK